MKIVVDMNLTPRWVEALRGAGIDADHWVDLGLPTAVDREIFEHALKTGAIVLTHDLDFGAILAVTKGRGPSVVQIRAEDTSPESLGGIVIATLRQRADDLLIGALITIDPRRVRVSLLPLANA